MAGTEETPTLPKSMRHKKILSEAEDDPEASIDEIAERVPSATPELVERVLEEYGDPASTDADGAGGPADEETAAAGHPSESDAAGEGGDTEEATDGTGQNDGAADADEKSTDQSSADETEPRSAGSESVANTETFPDPAELTDKQRETLEAVAARPTATQRELADELGVSRATISNRVNDIPGFDWPDRQSFVEHVLDPEDTDGSDDAGRRVDTDPDEAIQVSDSTEAPVGDGSRSEPAEPAADDTMATDVQVSLEELSDRIASLEDRIDALETAVRAESESVAPDSASTVESESAESASLSPDVVHEVIRSCVESEDISEDDEVGVVAKLLD